MAVAFEATASSSGGAVSSLTFNVTLGGASTTRAVCCGAVNPDLTTAGAACTIGGESLTIVTNSDGTTTSGTVCLGKATSLTGVQSVVFQWTAAHDTVVGIVSATGVDQVTPLNNGVFKQVSNQTTISQVVTSNAGDLTVSTVKALDTVGGTVVTVSTNQTQRWNVTNVGGNVLTGAGDTGPGTASPTHTWTGSAATNSMGLSAANFNQAAAVSIPVGGTSSIFRVRQTVWGMR